MFTFISPELQIIVFIYFEKYITDIFSIFRALIFVLKYTKHALLKYRKNVEEI